MGRFDSSPITMSDIAQRLNKPTMNTKQDFNLNQQI